VGLIKWCSIINGVANDIGFSHLVDISYADDAVETVIIASYGLYPHPYDVKHADSPSK